MGNWVHVHEAALDGIAEAVLAQGNELAAGDLLDEGHGLTESDAFEHFKPVGQDAPKTAQPIQQFALVFVGAKLRWLDDEASNAQAISHEAKVVMAQALAGLVGVPDLDDAIAKFDGVQIAVVVSATHRDMLKLEVVLEGLHSADRLAVLAAAAITNQAPLHIRAQPLAGNFGDLLDVRAILGGNTVAQPLADDGAGLDLPPALIELLSQRRLAASL